MSMNRIIKAIKGHKRFLVTTHVNPDPDGLCAEIAMMLFLQSMGKKVTIVNHEKVPNRYVFLPKVESMKAFNERMKASFDTAIILDCGDLKRIGSVSKLIKDKMTIFNIDHHITNILFGTYNLVDPNASSTTEVIYDLLKKARYPFDKRMAECIYMGIMTDTGSFRYENTTEKTHKIAGEMISRGVSATKAYKNLYDTIPLNDVRMFAKMIGDFDTHFKGQLVTLDLKKKVLSKLSEEFDVRDAIFKFLRSIKDVNLLIVFTEHKKNRTKVNFRSSGNVNVSKIAGHFGGGGHKKASGCMVAYGLENAKKLVLQDIQKTLNLK